MNLKLIKIVLHNGKIEKVQLKYLSNIAIYM